MNAFIVIKIINVIALKLNIYPVKNQTFFLGVYIVRTKAILTILVLYFSFFCERMSKSLNSQQITTKDSRIKVKDLAEYWKIQFWTADIEELLASNGPSCLQTFRLGKKVNSLSILQSLLAFVCISLFCEFCWKLEDRLVWGSDTGVSYIFFVPPIRQHFLQANYLYFCFLFLSLVWGKGWGKINK